MNTEEQKIFKDWKEQWGLDLISAPSTDRLKAALDAELQPSHMTLNELGDYMFVLSTQHLSLAAEMGRNFAAVKWNERDRVSRAKLNMLKPIHDSLDLHITVLKKLYDRKVREDMRARNGNS